MTAMRRMCFNKRTNTVFIPFPGSKLEQNKSKLVKVKRVNVRLLK